MTTTEPTEDAPVSTWGFFTRSRLLCAFLTLITIVVGLASRRFDSWLPFPLHKNTGDVLWAVMVFWIAALLFPSRSTTSLTVISALYAVGIECSKLLHFPGLVAFRATTAGHLIFGAVFSWADLLDYAIGILLAAAFDYWNCSALRLKVRDIGLGNGEFPDAG
ncbi:MAG: putative rane protein [Chthonomonadales bacterium]|nr:putative rane protein [Chthonomonadales bacterium]